MKRGFALALTLWIVAIMSLATAFYLSYSKEIVQKTTLLNKKLKAIFEVESAVELLKFYGTTGELSKNSIRNNGLKELFPNFPTKIFIDGRVIKWGKITIILQDTAGLIGTNDIEGLANCLIANKKISKDKKAIIKDSINDWLDNNSFRLLNGAESSFYKNHGYAYLPRNENYFSSVDELFLVRGLVDSNLDKKLLKSNLVISNYTSRNVMTMDIELLGAVYNLSKIDIEQLKKAKKDSDDTFLKLFYQQNQEAFQSEKTGTSPSRIVKATVMYDTKKIHEQVSLIISFRLGRMGASEVLEYNN